MLRQACGGLQRSCRADLQQVVSGERSESPLPGAELAAQSRAQHQKVSEFNCAYDERSELLTVNSFNAQPAQ